MQRLAPGNAVTVTRIDRLARSTFDLFGIDIVLRNQQGGQLSYLVLESIPQKHVSVANAECITAMEMFKVLIDMAKALEQMNDRTRGKKLVLPPGSRSDVDARYHSAEQ
jgi:DNA invertase Pin-like site-specific DNA recombinase